MPKIEFDFASYIKALKPHIKHEQLTLNIPITFEERLIIVGKPHE